MSASIRSIVARRQLISATPKSEQGRSLDGRRCRSGHGRRRLHALEGTVVSATPSKAAFRPRRSCRLGRLRSVRNYIRKRVTGSAAVRRIDTPLVSSSPKYDRAGSNADETTIGDATAAVYSSTYSIKSLNRFSTTDIGKSGDRHTEPIRSVQARPHTANTTNVERRLRAIYRKFPAPSAVRDPNWLEDDRSAVGSIVTRTDHIESLQPNYPT